MTTGPDTKAVIHTVTNLPETPEGAQQTETGSHGATLDRRSFLRSGGALGALALVGAPLRTLSVPAPARPRSGPTSGLAAAPLTAASTGLTADGLTVVAIVYTPDESGYWVVTSDGAVLPIDAPHFGDRPSLSEGEYVSALSPTPSGGGYWLFTTSGRVTGYGDALHYGDLTGVALAGPVVGAAALPSGEGYYMVGSDGGIFSFGAATYMGSVPQVLPGVALAQPVVGLVPTPSSDGYWLVAGDGGIFSFGAAGFYDSVPGVLPGVTLDEPVIGALASGQAYLMVASDGGIFNFGDSVFLGSRPGIPTEPGEIRSPVSAVTVTSDRSGYMMVDEVGETWGFGSAATPQSGNPSGPQARLTHTFIGKWPYTSLPLRWPSAEPIHYVLNNSFGPPEASQMVHDAVAEISSRTGLQFIFDGTTTEYVGHSSDDTPDHRESYQPSRYGDRWAPVWIGARPDNVATGTVGVAQPVLHANERVTTQIEVEIDGVLQTIAVGEPIFITGTVSYHWQPYYGAAALAELPAVILHELGHLVGLGHVNSVAELMYPSLTGVADFGQGDRLGLHLLGSTAAIPPAPGPREGIDITQFVSIASDEGTDSGPGGGELIPNPDGPDFYRPPRPTLPVCLGTRPR